MAGKSLIGARILGQRPRPIRAFVGLGIACSIAAVSAFFKSADGVVFALLPLCITLGAFIDWDGAFLLSVEASGLRDRHGRAIPFASMREIRALTLPARPLEKAFPIEIVHAGGAMIVPSRISLPSRQLYDFLREKVGARTSTLPAALSAFAVEQRTTFGPERVWSFGRRAGAPRTPHEGLRSWWIGGGITSLLWIVASRLPYCSGAWLGGGLVGLFISALILAADLGSRRGSGRVAPVAGLVVTPAAMALQLGDLQGQITWQEIQKIVYPAQSKFLAVSRLPQAIALEVAGARILVTDSFTHSLDEIHERMLRNWRSPL